MCAKYIVGSRKSLRRMSQILKGVKEGSLSVRRPVVSTA